MSMFPCRICGRLSGVVGTTQYGCLAEPHTTQEIAAFEAGLQTVSVQKMDSTSVANVSGIDLDAWIGG